MFGMPSMHQLVEDYIKASEERKKAAMAENKFIIETMEAYGTIKMQQDGAITNEIKQKRLERINKKIFENRNKSDLEQSVVYCTAYVDGEIAIEERIKSMSHEKKKMTRKEAIARISQFIPNIKSAEGVIDFYIEAGMLELVEEEAKIINHVDKGPIIVLRNGKVVYTEVDD